MSDYLQNLVGSALAPQPRIRPIIRSHDETPLLHPKLPAVEQNDDVPAPLPGLASRAEKSSPSLAHPPPSAPTLPESPSSPRKGNRSAPASPAHEDDHPLLPLHAATKPTTAFAARPASPTDSASSSAVRPLAPTGIPPAEAGAPERPRPDRPTTPPREIPRPGFRPSPSRQSTPLSPAWPLVTPPAESAARPPDIHVTIGRIEVRAAPAPEKPAPRAKSSAAPALSLHDYLKTRDGRSA